MEPDGASNDGVVLSVSPDGQTLVTRTTYGDNLRVWRVDYRTNHA